MNIKNILFFLICFTSAVSYADTVTIYTGDKYRAENDNGYGDIIGNNIFDITNIGATLDNDTDDLSINIFTNFAGQAGYMLGSTQNGLGVGYGDLLFGSYIPSTQDTSTDLWGTIEIDYAFVLNNNYSNTGGTGTLYSTENLTIVLTDQLMNSGYIFRNTAPVMVDRTDPDLTNATPLATGNWNVNAGVLNFNITNSPIDSEVVYWTMYCGNDVAFGYLPEGGGGGQGGEDISTPNVLSLFLAGLVCLIRKQYLA